MLAGRPPRNRFVRDSGPLRAMSLPQDARGGSRRRRSRELRRSGRPRATATPGVPRGDEDHAVDLRAGPEGEGAAEQGAVVRVARELLKWPFTE
jgi:hypothetical protein